jgi:spore maturation protein CgeB
VRVVIFCHSLVSDWNHGNAHFLRGICSELQARGHSVAVYEPRDAWSVENLIADAGEAGLAAFHRAYPGLSSIRYDPAHLDLEEALDGADLVLVHEWSEHSLVRRVGEHRVRAARPYVLLFHDTHHRAVTAPEQMAGYDLEGYDGVLAFGEVLRDVYVSRGWARRAFTWHEAADVRTFHPVPGTPPEADLVWIGNWGDEERTAELHEYLLGPVRTLGLRARIHGVRYPEHARVALADAGAEYRGYLPNHRAPEVFAAHRLTVHVPRGPYVTALPGVPTIRVFEALACGIPLVSSPWEDAEHLFTPGEDFLVARSGEEMREHLARLLADGDAREALSSRGLATILARHTCAHRADELLAIRARISAPDEWANARPGEAGALVRGRLDRSERAALRTRGG